MSNIVYKEDIIKELSKELNISENEIKEIVDLNLSYIKESVLDKDYVMINLPNLCKLRLNYRLALSSFYNLKNKNKGIRAERRFQALDRKIEILRQYKYKDDTLLNFKKPLFERLFKKINKSPKIIYLYRKMNRIIFDLEKRTNEIIEQIR